MAYADQVADPAFIAKFAKVLACGQGYPPGKWTTKVPKFALYVGEVPMITRNLLTLGSQLMVKGHTRHANRFTNLLIEGLRQFVPAGMGEVNIYIGPEWGVYAAPKRNREKP